MTRAQLERKMELHRERRRRLEHELAELRLERVELIRAGREAGVSINCMGTLLGLTTRRVSYVLAELVPPSQD